jgi:hypothetical protein
MRRNGRVARVAEINRDQRMVAIATDDDGYTIIEIVAGWVVGIGDIMTWEDGFHIGPAIYENVTRATREGVFVKDHSVSESDLEQQLRV